MRAGRTSCRRRNRLSIYHGRCDRARDTAIVEIIWASTREVFNVIEANEMRRQQHNSSTPITVSAVRRWRTALRRQSRQQGEEGTSAMRLAWEVDAGGQCGYTGSVKNITVSVDDETYRRARTKAAEQDTSLSALVRRFLVELVSEEDTERGLELQERNLRAQIRDFSAGDRLSREDVHGRRE